MLIWHENKDDVQGGNITSFVGGKPLLPSDFGVPKFARTGEDMTFFFQIETPIGSSWEGDIVSVFSTTTYADDDTFLPKLPDDLQNTELNTEFFDSYQTFFRVFVFKKSALVLSNDYREVVAFRKLNFSETVPSQGIAFGEANNTPNWIAEDEAPRKFNGSKSGISFLFQTKRDYEFGVVSGAPKQKEKNFEVEGGVTDKIGDGYSLFVENELYFFGLSERDRRYIYIVPQS